VIISRVKQSIRVGCLPTSTVYLHVSAIVHRVGSLKVAEVAQEGVSVVVRSHVGSEGRLVAEALRAKLAGVGSNLAVLDHVLLQHLAGLSHHRAQGAFKRVLKDRHKQGQHVAQLALTQGCE
jgi:hypothetical protein